MCHPSKFLNVSGVIGLDADLGRGPAPATFSMGGRRSVDPPSNLSSSSLSAARAGKDTASCSALSASAASSAASIAAL